MGNFLSLVGVENTKLWKRVSTWIMPLILAVVVIGICGLARMQTAMIGSGSVSISAGQSQSKTVSGGWRQTLEEQNKVMQASVDAAEKSDRQADKNQIDSEKFRIAKNQYYLDHNQKPAEVSDSSSNVFGSSYWQRVMNFGMGFFIALFAIIACTGLVAGEFSEGTMKTMISRPFARWQLLTAKLAAVIGYTVFLSVVAYLVTLGGIAAFFGTGGTGTPVLMWLGGSVAAVPGFGASLLTALLDLLSTIVYLLLAFCLSAVSRSRALATGLSIFLMFGGSFTMLIADNFSWGKLIFFADTAFSTFVTGGAPFYGITLGLALIICGVYCAAFLASAYVAFTKRDVAG
ncbi:MAG: ABC transporter permease subunit [Clostridiales bacterium]|nr:ABC transporter permease subunit [Clostridiales bacterium]